MCLLTGTTVVPQNRGGDEASSPRQQSAMIAWKRQKPVRISLPLPGQFGQPGKK
jgi:hypothetical protein